MIHQKQYQTEITNKTQARVYQPCLLITFLLLLHQLQELSHAAAAEEILGFDALAPRYSQAELAA